MKDVCINAVAETLGRKPSTQEIQGVENRIKDAVRQISREKAKTGDRSIPTPEDYTKAAELAANTFVHDIYKKRQQVALDAMAINNISSIIDRMPIEQRTPAALQELILMGKKGLGAEKLDFVSVEERGRGIFQDFSRRLSASMVDAGKEIEAFVKEANLFGDRSNLTKEQKNTANQYGYAVLKELRGENTNIPHAKTIAEIWRDTAETLRQQLNDAGFDIAKRDDWFIPQIDDMALIASAGRKEWLASLSPTERIKAIALGDNPPPTYARNAWIDRVWNTQDRSQYITLDGKRMNDVEYREALEAIFETKATDGANKVEAGAFKGTGGFKGRGSQQRVMVFKDAESHFNYMQEFTQKPLMGIMMEHLESKSRDLAVAQVFGANAVNNFKLINDRLYQNATAIDGGGKSASKMRQEKDTVERMFNYMAGLNGVRNSGVFEKTMGGLRNLMTSAMLGSSVITASTDQAIMRSLAHSMGLESGGMNMAANTIRGLFNKDAKRAISDLGLLTDAHSAIISRMGGYDTSKGWSGWCAEKTLQWSGLIAMDRANKSAFGLLLYKNIGELTRKFKTLAELKGSDKTILANKGFTEADWQIMASAELMELTGNGHKGITPDAIYAIPDKKIREILAPEIEKIRQGADTALANIGEIDANKLAKLKNAFNAETEQNINRLVRNAKSETVQKLIGITHGEMSSAVTTATGVDMFERDNMTGLKGELYRSFMLFKTTPFAQVRQFVNRARALEGQRALTFTASYLAGTAIMGMFAIQTKALLNGDNPYDMTKPSTLVRALLAGGALGVYGDLVLQDQTRYGTSIAATLGGPVLGLAEQGMGLVSNFQKLVMGKETDFGGDLLRMVKSVTPFSSLWYTKAVTNHLILQQLQDYVNPNYNKRLRDRAKKQYGVSSWWEQGSLTPNSAPDVSKAFGG